MAAAQSLRIPLQLLELDFGRNPAPYHMALCLARPDGHVAWRGTQSPAQPEKMLANITGG